MERIKQRKLRANGSLDSARVAKLADALDLGSSALIGVGVRLPPLAFNSDRQYCPGSVARNEIEGNRIHDDVYS